MKNPVLTQEDKVLKYLLSGRTLTPLEALSEIGTFSLAYHVWKLRQKGYPIKTNLRQSPSKKRYAKYWMDLNELQQMSIAAV